MVQRNRMTSELADRLKQSLRQDPMPLVICGAGFSTSATGGAAPSWKALIESGIAQVARLYPDKTGWVEWNKAALASGDAGEWIRIADRITTELGGRDHREFRE